MKEDNINPKTFITLTEADKIYFSPSKFMSFLYSKGIRKVKLGLDYSLVLVKDYIVSRINPSDVKEIVLNEVRALKEERFTDYILNKTTLFSLNFLNAVDTIELKIHRDNPREAFFYFRSGVVRVSKKGITPPIPFKDFKQLIWEEHILPRDYYPDQDIDTIPAVFADFITKLSNDDEQRFKRICSVIGYSLHDFKTSATARAVLITDQVITSNPEGGSGKSLMVDAISKLRKTISYDGKSFSIQKAFLWQKVDRTVRIVNIDDAKQGFNFEDLFSVITSGFRNVDKKNKDEIELSVEESPTIIITSNTMIRGNSGSFARRQHRVDIYQYFSRSRTPLDVYQHVFFSEWSEEEWSKFDVFMLSCVQLYLTFGVVECAEVDYEKKELIRSTSQSFAEWIEDNLEMLIAPEGVGTKYARDEYLESTNQRYLQLSDRKFTDYIKCYCNLFGFNYLALNNIRPRGFRIERDKKIPDK